MNLIITPKIQLILLVYFSGLLLCLRYFSKEKYYEGGWPGSLQKPSEVLKNGSTSLIMFQSILWPILPVIIILGQLFFTTFVALYYQIRFIFESDPVQKALYSLRRDFARDPSLIDIYSSADISRKLYQRRLKLAPERKK